MSMLRRQFLLGLVSAPLVTLAERAFALDLAEIKALKHGEFIWRPEVSPRGPVVILVSLPHQIVHVFRNGLAIAASTCSSGARGHETPTGSLRSCRSARSTIQVRITTPRCRTCSG